MGLLFQGAIPHSLHPSRPHTNPYQRADHEVSVLPTVVEKERSGLRRGVSSRAKQDRGAAVLNYVTGLTPPSLLPYCSLGAATSLPPS